MKTISAARKAWTGYKVARKEDTRRRRLIEYTIIEDHLVKVAFDENEEGQQLILDAIVKAIKDDRSEG